MTHHVGFTGTQRGMTQQQWATFWGLLLVRSGVFHEGDCIGADKQATHGATLRGFYIVCHPPINSSKRAFMPAHETRPPREYLDRNQDIVDESNELIATPGESDEQLRSGTWSTIRRARKRGIPVTIIRPDGSCVA